VRNSSLVERSGMDNNRASSTPPKLWDRKIGRGAFPGRGSCVVRHGGAQGKANVGMSNDKAGEKPVHRKTKVSNSMLIRIGLVGT
jgi:hypothetical protein